MIEREIKLAFASLDQARAAIRAAGAAPAAGRRRLDDRQFDTPAGDLRRAGCALRIRRDGDRTLLTLKGPVQPGAVKTREELEVDVSSAALDDDGLAAVGLRRIFRAEKFREEYDLDGARLAVDDTPIGVFVEIEGDAPVIIRVAARLGRTPADFRLESYQRLYREWCEDRGRTPGDMTFPDAP